MVILLHVYWNLLLMMIKTIDIEKNGINVHQATKTGYIFCPVGGIFDASYPKSKLRRGRVQGNGSICPTLTCAPESLWIVDSIQTNEDDEMKKVIKNLRVRKLTERECFRLMGVDDDRIDKLIESNISRSQLYKMAGNSIVVDVIYNIFRTMFVENNKEHGQSNKLF